MLATLITNIKSSLQAVTEVAVVYERPLGENEQFTNFPAVVFFPAGPENSFETNTENKREWAFSIFVVTEANIKTVAEATVIMANAVEAVMNKIDNAWNGGTDNGHRILQWWSGDKWDYLLTEVGGTIVAPLTLHVRYLTNN
ncbi:MAG: hypothetical protein UW68_C0026G0010 [Candidatus Collierbacteria bacterium GW2011_GWB1_44_6]|uniref:Phage protein n=1 Tax=Candidatus Collierbacteria bacterium GW2011_GWB1_44_6 TaxID=1618384 RepID=A0A0G1JMI0_9BACT|nr:MAG: hypothetical protein UW68_C0026G0010 [Candidatus Collierbacteria bacterium GW2011_GWB1_44_6]